MASYSLLISGKIYNKLYMKLKYFIVLSQLQYLNIHKQDNLAIFVKFIF